MSDRTRQRGKQECDDTEHKNRPSRAELVARAVPLQPVLREHAGTGEADGRGSGPSPDRRRLLPHFHTDQIRRLRGGHPNRHCNAAMPTAPAPGRWVDTQPSRHRSRSTLCSTCTARVVSPRKTGCSSTGVMPTPRHSIPDSTPSWSRGLWQVTTGSRGANQPDGVIAVLQERWSAWIALVPDRRNPITPER